MNFGTLFSAAGRIPRKQWWLTVLAILVLEMIFFGGSAALFGATAIDASGHISLGGGGAVGGILGFIVLAVVFVISLMAGIKRCHDRDRSGWFILLAAVPFANIWVFIELAFLRGTVGPNRFGPDPLGGTAMNAFAA